MIIVTSGDRDSLNVLLELAGTDVRILLGPAPMSYSICYDSDKDSFDYNSTYLPGAEVVARSHWLYAIANGGEPPTAKERVSVSRDGGQTWIVASYNPHDSYENLLIRPVELPPANIEPLQWEPLIGQRVLFKDNKHAHIVVGKYDNLFYIKFPGGTDAKGVKLDKLSPAPTDAEKVAQQINPDLTSLTDILEDLSQRNLIRLQPNGSN